MKRPLFAFVCLFCLASVAAAQEIKFAPLGDFRLENGETIRDLQIGYRTVGTLNADKSNAILWPTWFTGTSAQLLGFVGPGKLLDPSKYFVILVDALGDGKRAARDIDRVLRAEPLRPEDPVEIMPYEKLNTAYFRHAPRIEAPLSPAEGRRRSQQVEVARCVARDRVGRGVRLRARHSAARATQNKHRQQLPRRAP